MRTVELPGAAEVTATIAEVLSRPAFQSAEPGFWETLQNHFWSAVAVVLEWVFQRLPIPDEAVSYLPIFIRAALALTAALLLWHLVRWLAGRRRAISGSDSLSADEATPALGPRDWEMEAQKAAAAGRFHEAILALYQALIRRLENRGLVRYDRAKTPGDYRREVSGHPHAARGLEHFLLHFEPAAFGNHPPDRVTYERLVEASGEISGE